MIDATKLPAVLDKKKDQVLDKAKSDAPSALPLPEEQFPLKDTLKTFPLQK